MFGADHKEIYSNKFPLITQIMLPNNAIKLLRLIYLKRHIVITIALFSTKADN